MQRPCSQGEDSHSLMGVSQYRPVTPGGHTHSTSFRRSSHVAPPAHGVVAHSSMSMSHTSPETVSSWSCTSPALVRGSDDVFVAIGFRTRFTNRASIFANEADLSLQ